MGEPNGPIEVVVRAVMRLVNGDAWDLLLYRWVQEYWFAADLIFAVFAMAFLAARAVWLRRRGA